MKRILVLFLWLWTSGGPTAQSFDPGADVLQGELWALLQPLTPQEVERPALDKEIAAGLAQECNYYFSGMIYGWKFTYRPSDQARKVGEILEVEPLAKLPPHSPRLTAGTPRLVESEGRVYLEFTYWPKDSEIQRRKGWAASDSYQSGGRGEERVIERQTSRTKAFEQALKDAVRNLLKPRYYNKPAEVRGEAVLRAFPRFTLEAGSFHCTATFLLRELSVRPYTVY